MTTSAESLNLSVVDWDRNPDLYLHINEGRQAYLFQFLMQFFDTEAARSVVDFGCGDGAFLDILAQKSVAGEFYGIDTSLEMLKAAQQRKTSSNISFFNSISPLDENQIDLLYCIAVWMTWKDYDQCVYNLRTISTLLNDSGTVVFAVTHPCFREQRYEFFRTNFDNRDYLSSGTPFTVFLADRSTSVCFEDYHWNLSDMSAQLADAGLKIDRLFEVSDPIEPKVGSPWLVLQASKAVP